MGDNQLEKEIRDMEIELRREGLLCMLIADIDPRRVELRERIDAINAQVDGHNGLQRQAQQLNDLYETSIYFIKG